MNPERVPGLIADLAPFLAVVCEAQVIDYSRRAGYGPWVKFRMENPESLSGFAAGQRFHLLLVAIGDDDVPATPNPEDRKPYKKSQIAGMLCNDPQFWQWIKHAYGDQIEDKDGAAKWVREACAVHSRSLLDSNPAAGETFDDIVRDYDSYKHRSA